MIAAAAILWAGRLIGLDVSGSLVLLLGILSVGLFLHCRDLLRGRREALVALELAGLPFVVLTADGHIRRCNQAFAQLAGRSLGTLGGMALSELQPREWSLAQERLHGELAANGDGQAEVWLERSGEAPRLLVLRGRRLGSDAVLVCEDLSHQADHGRMQIEATTRARRFMQSLIDVIPHPVFVRDASGRYLMANEAHARVLKLPLHEIVGRAATELPASPVHLHDPDEDRGVLAGLCVSREQHVELPKGSAWRDLLLSKASCEGEGGEAVIVGTCFDLSCWRDAERGLQQALGREQARSIRVQDYVKRLIDVIPQPVYVKDARGCYLLVNEAFCRERGCSREDLIGHASHGFAPDPSVAAAIADEDMRVLAGETIRKEECLLHMHAGEERFRLITKGACLDAEGRPVIVVASFDVTRWHQAERELKEALGREVERWERTQAFIQRLIDLIPQPVYVKDSAGRYLMVNDAQIAQMGIPREQIVGTSSYAWVQDQDPELAALVVREDQEVLAGRVVLKEEHRETRVGGGEWHRLVSKGSCLDADGQPVIVVANFDITRWCQAERELKEALEREQHNHERTQHYIQRLIDVIPYPVYVKDSDSRYMLVNDAFVQDRKLSKEALAGRPSASIEVVGEDNYRRMINEDREVLNDGRIVYKEEYKPHPVTGVERYRVVSKAGCEDAVGRRVIVVSVFDVTPWRLAERQLAEALTRETARRERIQQYVQRLIDVIPQPVYVKDAESRYLLVNEAFARDRGLPREALIGMSSALRPETVRIVFEEDARVLAGETVLKEECRPHPISGHPRYRVIAKGSCLDDEGRPVIVGANFDVTPWRIAEARLSAAKDEAERANAAKSLFLTNMSHELRTPMHGILSFARLGVERSASVSPERLHAYFERILSSGERLMGLLDDLLDLAKLESGRMEMNLAQQDAFPLVRQVIDEFEAFAAANGIGVRLEAQEPARARIDAKLFGQILRNLLSNALKFAPAGSEVLIQLDPAEIGVGKDAANLDVMRPALEMRVSDRGPGIPEAELESVFAKFVQGSSTRSGAGGTGLGLAICREIVSAHHGLIYARNRFGGGAEFIVRLPAD